MIDKKEMIKTKVASKNIRWIDRLYNEHRELELRFKKLDNFIYNSGEFDLLCEIDRDLLCAQSSSMYALKIIMELRLHKAIE